MKVINSFTGCLAAALPLIVGIVAGIAMHEAVEYAELPNVVAKLSAVTFGMASALLLYTLTEKTR